MMRYGNLTWALPATLAIAGVWCVSACANWFFGASLGDGKIVIGTLTTAQLFSGASLASDVLKTVMLFAATAALMSRQWMAAAVTSAIWAACAIWSVASAVGFVALNNGSVTDRRGHSMEGWTQLSNEIRRTQDRRDWVPKHRPVDTVRAEITGVENDFIFIRAKRCSDVTTPESATLCKHYADLKQEEANGIAAANLDGKLASLRHELGDTERVTSANPFADMMAGLIGSRAASITTGQALFLAMLLELISGPGLWAVWASALARPYQPRGRAEAPGAVIVPPQPVPATAALIVGGGDGVTIDPPPLPPVRAPDPAPIGTESLQNTDSVEPIIPGAGNNPPLQTPFVPRVVERSPPPKPRSKAERLEAVDAITRRWIAAHGVRKSIVGDGMAACRVYADYLEFAGRSGVGPSHFGRSIKRCGFATRKTAGGAVYKLAIAEKVAMSA